MTDIDRAARAAYEAAMAGYARMTPLSPELEQLAHEPGWDALPDAYQEHWRSVARAALGAVP